MSKPFAGQPCWIITDGKAGMDVQCIGIAHALGARYELKHVTPHGIYRTLAPYGPVDPKERFAAPGTPFAPPFPPLAIATGRASIPYIRALGRRAGLATYRLVLQDPKTRAGIADLIWVPEHDRRRGPNVIRTLTAPHSFTAERLSALRARLPDWLTALPSPRVGVVLGGKNGVYRFTEADDDRLQRCLHALSELGASFLVTPSRRTHKRLIAAVEAATEGSPRVIWDGAGDNPYPQMLAGADLLVVTADSVNMTGEACATGKPVYVFSPSGGSPKFRRFHEALRRHGATRALDEPLSRIEAWSYPPLDSAHTIAAEIEQRWMRRRATLGAA
ncbi:MAG: mitochondrial fission ELM1 family protein [Hyphomicrobiaceae bacterium]